MLGWLLLQPCSPVNWLLQGWLYFCKWPVCKCTSVWISVATFLIFVPLSSSFSLVYGSRVLSSPDPDHFCFLPPPFRRVTGIFLRTKFLCCFYSQPIILYVVPSVAWGEDGIDELHVVGYVYQELLVCTANFTYIYATSLSTLYSLCLLYTHIQHIE